MVQQLIFQYKGFSTTSGVGRIEQNDINNNKCLLLWLCKSQGISCSSYLNAVFYMLFIESQCFFTSLTYNLTRLLCCVHCTL